MPNNAAPDDGEQHAASERNVGWQRNVLSAKEEGC